MTTPGNAPEPVVTEGEARHAGGALAHYVTSSQPRLRDFIRWAEAHPGELDQVGVLAWLAGMHSQLAPDCPDPVTRPPASPHGPHVAEPCVHCGWRTES